MPWFAVDDSAHTHPKIVKAGNAAVGLWMRCGSYAAQHLTDGIVPGAIATMYGTGPQIAKLVKLGLWHSTGHSCLRCPQPADGDYVMHEYHQHGNPTRQQVLERRARAAEKKRKQRGGHPGPPPPDKNPPGIGDDSSANRDRIEDESDSIRRPLFDEDAGREPVSRGDSLGTRARAFPSPPLPNKEVAEVGEGSTGSRDRADARSDDRPAFDAPIDIDGFELNDGMRRWAHDTFPKVDVDYETAQFIDHFRGNGSRRPNWYAEWQKWIRRANKWASERQQRSNVVPISGAQRPGGIRGPVLTAAEINRLTIEDVL